MKKKMSSMNGFNSDNRRVFSEDEKRLFRKRQKAVIIVSVIMLILIGILVYNLIVLGIEDVKNIQDKQEMEAEQSEEMKALFAEMKILDKQIYEIHEKYGVKSSTDIRKIPKSELDGYSDLIDKQIENYEMYIYSPPYDKNASDDLLVEGETIGEEFLRLKEIEMLIPTAKELEPIS